MAGRSDVIVCSFVLVTLLFFLDLQRAYAPWLGGVTFFLAALSKETALACVVLVPLLDLLRSKHVDWRRYVPLASAGLVYFVLRQQAVGAFVGGTATGAPPQAIAGDALRAMGFYVVQTLLPARLCAYVSSVPAGAGYLLVGLLGLLLGAVLFIIGWRRHHWPLAFLTAWFFATLAPAFTVLARRSASAPVADRYLYVPSVASCLLLAWALVRVAERQRLAARWVLAVLVVVSLILGVHASRYARVWADDLSFWSDVAAKVPDDALPHLELAGALQQRNRLEDAERALQQALAGRADAAVRAMTYNALGNLYRRRGRYDDAARAFEAGIQIGPHPTLYHNLGMTLMLQLEAEQRRGDQAAIARDIVRARNAFEQALQLGNVEASPHGFPQWDAAKTHALLGQVLFSLGDRTAAREHLETSLRLEPTGPAADVTRRYLQSMGP
jgi:protein O-mannosyl-transferase